MPLHFVQEEMIKVLQKTIYEFMKRNNKNE